MDTKHKPAAKLPWKVSGLGYLSSDKRILARTEIANSFRHEQIILTLDDADYIAHAANAYPQLVNVMRAVNAKFDQERDAKYFASHAIVADLLRKLGEE